MLSLLRETWGEIAFLSAVGGGFWFTLEPPIGNNVGVLSGFAGAFVLAAALGVRSILRRWHDQFRVVIAVQVLAVVFLLAAVPILATYVVKESNLVIDYSEGGRTFEIVRGTEYHEAVFDVKISEGMSDSKLLRSRGGIENRDLVWKRKSIMDAESDLVVGYMMSFLLTLISTMFFVEVLRIRRTE